MNIFVTNIDPDLAVQDLDDKRLFHMPRESMEMITAAIHNVKRYWVLPFPFWDGIKRGNRAKELYYHPCSLWTRKNIPNLWWHLNYLTACIDEYIYRFGEYPSYMEDFKKVRDACLKHFNFSGYISTPTSFRNSSLYKQEKNVEIAYRKTMCVKWFKTDIKQPNTWTKRGEPEWTKLYKSLGFQTKI